MHKATFKCFGTLEQAAINGTVQLLEECGIEIIVQAEPTSNVHIVLIDEVTPEVLHWIGAAAGNMITTIVLALRDLESDGIWRLMAAGASDVLVWRRAKTDANELAARLERLEEIGNLMGSPAVAGHIVGRSRKWQATLRDVVEVGAFTNASVLILGESGTGKELLAHLIHQLDGRRDKGELVIVDCTTISPELSGSEFFGHERGSFTGAVASRDGAFAEANGGTLFLDEIGELPLTLQAQLLRVIQERKFRRVGSNHWQPTEFRLVCATNRNLESCIAEGTFRSDLYHRIAGWVCRVPALRERPEDILPLADHFLAQLSKPSPPPKLDQAVQHFLLSRSYPGNVRELRHLTTRIWHRHAGSGVITPGDIPPTDRDVHCPRSNPLDQTFESAIRHALTRSIGLKQLNRLTAETAIRIALEEEQDNVHRAAVRLGVTDRAVQLRRANHRPTVSALGNL